jgi:hypothetical protein
MRKTLALAAVLAVASIGLSGCYDGRPGHASDRHHRHGHDRGHDRGPDRDHGNWR